MVKSYVVAQTQHGILDYVAGPFPTTMQALMAADTRTQWVVEDDSADFKLIQGIPSITITSQIAELEVQLKALKTQLPLEVANRLKGKFEARTGHDCDAEWHDDLEDPEGQFMHDEDLAWIVTPKDFPAIKEVTYRSGQGYTFYLDRIGNYMKPKNFGTGKTESEAWLNFPYESIIGEV